MLHGTQGNVPGTVLNGYERTHDMSKRNISPQAVRICGLTLLCLVIMFGVAAANKAKGGEKLVSEYTVQDETLPRHVKFESMPSDMPQMTAAWYFKYRGLGQFDMCKRLFPQNQLEALNFDQEDMDFKDGYYIQEYIVHGFETLPQEAYADMRGTRWSVSPLPRDGHQRLWREVPNGGTANLPGILQWAGSLDCGKNGRYLTWA